METVVGLQYRVIPEKKQHVVRNQAKVVRGRQLCFSAKAMWETQKVIFPQETTHLVPRVPGHQVLKQSTNRRCSNPSIPAMKL